MTVGTSQSQEGHGQSRCGWSTSDGGRRPRISCAPCRHPGGDRRARPSSSGWVPSRRTRSHSCSRRLQANPAAHLCVPGTGPGSSGRSIEGGQDHEAGRRDVLRRRGDRERRGRRRWTPARATRSAWRSERRADLCRRRGACRRRARGTTPYAPGRRRPGPGPGGTVGSAEIVAEDRGVECRAPGRREDHRR